MIKNLARLIILISLISCSNLTPNKDQVESTKQNLDCYQNLVELIKKDSLTINKLIVLRDSKLREKNDPINVKSKYRLIGFNELESKILDNWNNCSERVRKNNDLRGLRFIDNDLIILEIDKFDRHSFSEKYSRGITIETHRIIITNQPYDETKFRFKGEKTKWNFDLGNNWNYQISHNIKY